MKIKKHWKIKRKVKKRKGRTKIRQRLEKRKKERKYERYKTKVSKKKERKYERQKEGTKDQKKFRTELRMLGNTALVDYPLEASQMMQLIESAETGMYRRLILKSLCTSRSLFRAGKFRSFRRPVMCKMYSFYNRGWLCTACLIPVFVSSEQKGKAFLLTMKRGNGNNPFFFSSSSSSFSSSFLNSLFLSLRLRR